MHSKMGIHVQAVATAACQAGIHWTHAACKITDAAWEIIVAPVGHHHAVHAVLADCACITTNFPLDHSPARQAGRFPSFGTASAPTKA